MFFFIRNDGVTDHPCEKNFPGEMETGSYSRGVRAEREEKMSATYKEAGYRGNQGD